ncbi:MAG: L-seryl-tRNA(Sec) selenium transferase [Candidatus Promineifilaceae bacterium]
MDGEHKQLLRDLPSVDRLLSADAGQALAAHFGREQTIAALRQVLDLQRKRIRAQRPAEADGDRLLAQAGELLLGRFAPGLQPVINATGVIIHTNLGRAPLSPAAVAALQEAAGGYTDLELELEQGGRGGRGHRVEALVCELTGAEAALVVNNNAAAVLLALTALCAGREVLISRGQLIEIGGGFRLPEVMAHSGALLAEVGATNRTHLSDYRQAIGANTAAILVAHQSNFRQVGFTAQPELRELAPLAAEHDLLLLFDQGSGALDDLSSFGLASEPSAPDAIAAGADVVCFSGDKLVGGPQAGILCGRAAPIAALKRHPLARAVRSDKLTLAALGETLAAHLSGRAAREIPVWRMIARSLQEIDQTAEAWAARWAAAGIQAEVTDGLSTVGGGSLPGSSLPSRVVAIRTRSEERLAAALRANRPAVLARVAGGRLLLDPRTVLPTQEESLLKAVERCSLGQALSE